MNSICICRVFTKLLLLGAHSVSMKYCSCCLDLGMVQLSISHIGASSHQLLWSQTVILSVLSHLFSLCFLNASHHEYAMSYSPERVTIHAVFFIYIHTYTQTHFFIKIYIYLFIYSFFLPCPMRTVISSGHDPKLMESYRWIRSIWKAYISCCWGSCNDIHLTFVYRCSCRQECVIIFHVHFN